MRQHSALSFLVLFATITGNPISATDFQVFLDLQWDYCSDLLTLICTHNNTDSDPLWIYNGTPDDGIALRSIPGAGTYTEATSTRHVAVIRGIENVMALDSFTFQCVFHRQSVPVKSNKEQYYWGYAEERTDVEYGNSFCYYNCTVDVSMATQCHNRANISVSSSPPTANQSIPTPNGLNYNISDLQRCQRYMVEVTAQVGAHKYTNQTQDTVMLRPGRAEIMSVNLFMGLNESRVEVLLRKSEDDCDGYETTRYTFFIDDKEVGDMTADMLGLSFFNKRGDMAVVTLTVPAYVTNSSRFNLTVVLSNTVEFTESVTSSTDGVSSTVRSNTWSTTSDPFYYGQSSTATDVCHCNSSSAQGITTGVASILVLVLVVGVCSAFIVGWWLGRRKMKKGLDQSKSLQNDLQNAAYDVPSSTMQTNPAYMTVEECTAT